MLSLSSLEVNPLLPVSIDSVDPIIGSSGVSGTDGVISSGEISVYAAGTGAELNRGFGAASKLRPRKAAAVFEIFVLVGIQLGIGALSFGRRFALSGCRRLSPTRR